jgi:hypothetical protein
MVLVVPKISSPSSVLADDGGQALSEGCGVSAERGFNFGPVASAPFVAGEDAAELFEDISRLYELVSDHPYSNAEIYFEIAYGVHLSTHISIGETTYGPDEVMRMPTSKRLQIAQDWFTQKGIWPQMGTFLEEFEGLANRRSSGHLRTFCEWRVTVLQFEDGHMGYWNKTKSQNPNAARFYESVMDSAPSRDDRQILLTSTWAFLAVAGVQPHIDSPLPIETNDFDPVGIANHFPP